MLAAGTMISLRQQHSDEALGLVAEQRRTTSLALGSEEDALDVRSIPAQGKQHMHRSTVVTAQNSIASVVVKSRGIAAPSRRTSSGSALAHSRNSCSQIIPPDTSQVLSSTTVTKKRKAVEFALSEENSGATTPQAASTSMMANSSNEPPDLWARNPILQELDRIADSDTSYTKILWKRDMIYFALQGIPYRVELSHPWPMVSQIWAWVNIILICVSCVVLMVQSMVEARREEWQRQLLFSLETFAVVFFCVDYVLRFCFCRPRLRWLVRPLNVIDILSIAPYFIDLAVSGEADVSVLTIVRTVRLVRVVRIMKLSKHSGGLHDVAEAFSRATGAMSLLFSLLAIAIFLFSTAVYITEQSESSFHPVERVWYRSDGEKSSFQSIFHSMWWTVVTMTTVGYGGLDVPITLGGKLVATTLMICGVFVVAFPTVILSASFHRAYTNRMTVLALKRLIEGETSAGDESSANMGLIEEQSASIEEKEVSGSKGKTESSTTAPFLSADQKKALERAFARRSLRLRSSIPGHHEQVPELRDVVLFAEEARMRAAAQMASNIDRDISSGFTRVPLACSFEAPESTVFDDFWVNNSSPARKRRSDVGAPSESKNATSSDTQSDLLLVPPQSRQKRLSVSSVFAPERKGQLFKDYYNTSNAPTVRAAAVLNAENNKAQGSDVIFHGVLFYAPILQFECVAGTNILLTRIAKIHPKGYSFTLRLLLDSKSFRKWYYQQYVTHPPRWREVLKEKKVRKSTLAKLAAPGSPVYDGNKSSELHHGFEDEEENDDGNGTTTSKPTNDGKKLLEQIAPARSRWRPGDPKISGVSVKRLRTLKISLSHTLQHVPTIHFGDINEEEHPSVSLSRCYLATEIYEQPQTSFLPVVIIAPDTLAFKALVMHASSLVFQFFVEYSEGEERNLTLEGLTKKRETKKAEEKNEAGTLGRNSSSVAPPSVASPLSAGVSSAEKPSVVPLRRRTAVMVTPEFTFPPDATVDLEPPPKIAVGSASEENLVHLQVVEEQGNDQRVSVE